MLSASPVLGSGTGADCAGVVPVQLLIMEGRIPLGSYLGYWDYRSSAQENSQKFEGAAGRD